MDIKSFDIEKSWFKRQLSAVYPSSNFISQPWGTIVGIGTGVLSDRYDGITITAGGALIIRAFGGY